MRRSVLYVVTEPWYFANHRLDHAKALMADGFDVHVATRDGDRHDELVAAGCTVHRLELDRGAGGALSLLREARAVRRIVRTVRPSVVHAVALKPVAICLSLLASRRRPALVLSVNGLGLSAADGGARLELIRRVIAAAGGRPRVELLFQTLADRDAVLGRRRGGVVVPGVGVDLAAFARVEPAPRPPTRVVYLGRAVVSKGLTDLVDAVADDPVSGVEVHVYCTFDDSSPGTLDAGQIERIRACPGVVLHPPTREPALALAGAHAAILPSRAGEGVSKFVLEALACGRPVLISAESGSGEVIEAGVTGLVFPAQDTAATTSDAAVSAAAEIAAAPELFSFPEDCTSELLAAAPTYLREACKTVGEGADRVAPATAAPFHMTTTRVASNIRRGPDTRYPVLTTAAPGTRLQLVGYTRSRGYVWYLTNFGGWIRADLVSEAPDHLPLVPPDQIS